MYKINSSDLNSTEYNILVIEYGTFDVLELIDIDYNDVIGSYKAWQIVWECGLSEAQDKANEFGISEPLNNIEALASYIVDEIINNYAEEVEEIECSDCGKTADGSLKCAACDDIICKECYEENDGKCCICKED